jgi:hypothetical protein
MDEAGTGDPEHEPFLVVAAALVHADRQAKHLESALRRVQEKHCPDAPTDFVFHAMHIFSGQSGNRYFSRERWPKEKRWAILDDLVKIPGEYDVPVVHGHIDRVEGMPNARSPKERLIQQHSVAFMLCAMRADWWLRFHGGNREVGMIIAEDNTDVKEALRRMQGFAHRPTDIHNLVPGWEKYLPFRKIIDTVHYAGKKQSALLQLADVCAFIIKRQLIAQRRPVSEGTRFYAPLVRAHFQPELISLTPAQSSPA